jgi:hypothetical protein
MFLKLVKHESHAAARAMVPLLGGLLAMAILARGSIWMMESVESPVTSMLGVFLVSIFFLACGAMVVTTTILMMVRFAKSVHGDEGYLTHTLPVSVSTILLSRLLVSFLAVLLSFGAVYAGVRIATLGVDSIESLGVSFRVIIENSGIETKSILLKLCCVGVLSILSMILMIYAAISIGHSFPTGKTGKSVLFFFVLYIAAQIITSIALVGVLTAEYGFDGLRTIETNDFPSSLFWFTVGQSVLFGSVYYFLTWITTKKRLNLA